jgi:RNA polymerase sigma-70 factor (ECF subfamily)
MRHPPSGAGDSSRVRELYERAVADYGNALKRLTRAYESDADRRQDVLQEIHMALWESLARFDGRSSLGTWVYRVAHNTATSICIRRKSSRLQLVSLEDVEVPTASIDRERAFDERQGIERLLALIQQLRPLDRQVMLLYLEDIDARAIGEIVGLSAANVATKIHRVKKVLAQQFQEGVGDESV